MSEIYKDLDKLYEKIEKIENENKRLQNIIDKNKYTTDELNEIKRLQNIIKEVRKNVKGIKKINNEVYKQIDILESFYSRKWCEDITNDILEILDKGE